MRACRTSGCEKPKPPGRGRQYCDDCRAAAEERNRLDAIRRSAEWRAQNPDKYIDGARRYYMKTADAQRARARAWYRDNPERVLAHRAKVKALKLPRVHKYGISHADYQSMLAAQGGGCAICRRTENGKRHNFDIDHDHDTGAIRGLLCNRCNRLLSNAQDDPAILESALVYLMGIPEEAVA